MGCVEIERNRYRSWSHSLICNLGLTFSSRFRAAHKPLVLKANTATAFDAASIRPQLSTKD